MTPSSGQPSSATVGVGIRALRTAAGLARGALPRPLYAAVRGAYRLTRGAVAGGAPPVGGVRFGDLRRTTPIDSHYGFSRGQPVDRFYMDRFLAAHAADVRGRVLEIKDAAYTRTFGGDRVTRADVLDIDASNPHATIVADLTAWADAPTDAFDCVILTQTLQYLFDIRGAIATLHRVLAPGGVLLVTTPGLSAQERDAARPGPSQTSEPHWYWLLTAAAVRRALGEVFGADQITVEPHGNVLAASAFLYGLSASDLTPAELDARDAAYDVLIAARAVKRAA